jgi:hypothetical protein
VLDLSRQFLVEHCQLSFASRICHFFKSKSGWIQCSCITFAQILLHELVEVQVGCEAVLVSFAKAKSGPKEVLYLLSVLSRCPIPFSIGVRLLEELCRLRTSLCLQFKPHHIAAGAIFLAAKFLKVKLPSDGDKVWWQEFGVTPRQLEGWFSFLQPSPFKG